MIRPHLALVLVTLIYGLFYVVIKLIVQEVPPWEAFCIRLGLATPLLFLLERVLVNGPFPNKKDWLKITLIGILGVPLLQSTILIGIQLTSALHAGFIVGTSPLSALILGVFLKEESFSWRKLVGIIIAFTGLACLLLGKEASGHLPPFYLWGDLIVFLNLTAWALYLILSRPLLKTYHPLTLTSYTFLFSTLAALPFMVPTLWSMSWGHFTQQLWLELGFVGIFGTISYALNNYALSKLSASTVSIYVLLQPFLVALFSHWLLHEPLGPLTWVFGGVSALGVFIATRKAQEIKLNC